MLYTNHWQHALDKLSLPHTPSQWFPEQQLAQLVQTLADSYSQSFALKDESLWNLFLKQSRIAQSVHVLVRAIEQGRGYSGATEGVLRVEPAVTRRNLQMGEIGIGGMFRSLDPDCNIREKIPIARKDLQDQKAYMQMVWNAFRSGKTVPPSDQHWRELSFMGQVGVDESVLLFADNVRVWKNACHDLSKLEFGDSVEHEQGLYGVFSGDPSKVEYIASDVLDVLWSRLKCFLDNCFENFCLSTIQKDPILRELYGEGSMEADFDESAALESCFNEVISFVRRNQFLRQYCDQLIVYLRVLHCFIVEKLFFLCSPEFYKVNEEPGFLQLTLIYSLGYAIHHSSSSNVSISLNEYLSNSTKKLLLNYLIDAKSYELFCPLMVLEDQIECLVDLFFREKKLDQICTFIDTMSSRYPNFMVKSSIRELADCVLAKTVALYNNQQLEAKVNALASFFNSFSSSGDEDSFTEIAHSFYVYLSHIAHLNNEQRHFGFDLSKSLSFELARSPKLHFLVTYFAAFQAFEELEESISKYEESQKILEKSKSSTFESIPVLRTLVEVAKLKIREFLEMSQIDGVVSRVKDIIPMFLLEVLDMCLFLHEYEFAFLVTEFVTRSPANLYHLFSPTLLEAYIHKSTEIHARKNMPSKK